MRVGRGPGSPWDRVYASASVHTRAASTSTLAPGPHGTVFRYELEHRVPMGPSFAWPFDKPLAAAPAPAILISLQNSQNCSCMLVESTHALKSLMG